MPDPSNAPAAAHAITVEPVISFARRARPGARCVLTVDLRHDCSPENWPYSDEEYELRCVLDARPLFSHKAVGDAAVVLHRYGGSYGPATFVLTAAAEEMTGSIRITLVNRAGLPAETLELKDIRIARGAEPPPAQTFIRLQQQAVSEPAPSAPLQEQAVFEQADNAPLQEQAVSEPAPDAPLQEHAAREPEPDAPLQEQTVGEPAVRAGRGPLPVADLKRFFQQCSPEAFPPSFPADPLYLDARGARGRGPDLKEQLAGVILEAGSPTCQFVCAQPGAGLTTELFCLGFALGTGSLVVHVDFDEHVDVFEPFDQTDILRTIAYRLDREAASLEGRDPSSTDGYPARLFRLLEQILPDLRDMEIQPFGSSLMLELRNDPSLRSSVRRAVEQHGRAFQRHAQEEIEDAYARIRTHLGEGKPVVVVVDGLGKTTPLREESRASIEETLVSLMSSREDFLRLPCHTILSVPPWFAFRKRTLALFADTPIRLLPHFQVQDRSGERDPRGVSALTEIVRRRVDVERVFGPPPNETLPPLIMASGGCVRDLLRLVQEVLTGTNEFPVDPSVVTRTIARYRENIQKALRTSDVSLLAVAAQSHQLSWHPEEPHRIDRLLGMNAILVREDEDEWYDVHPVLREASEPYEGTLLGQLVAAKHP